MKRPRPPAEKPEKVDGRRLRGEETRRRIIAAALELAQDEGLDALTIGRIAALTEIGKSTVLQQFEDKGGMQLAVLDAAAEVFRERVVAPAQTAPPGERLNRLCELAFDYLDGRVFPGGCILHAVSSEIRERSAEVQARIAKQRGAWRKTLLDAVREAQRQGVVSDDADAELITFQLLAFQSAANVDSLLDRKTGIAGGRKATRQLLVSVSR